MRRRTFSELVDFVSVVPSPFIGVKKYISTGALDNDQIDESAVDQVTFESRPARANLTAQAGDILFAKMANTKKTIELDETTEQFIYSTGFCAVRAKKNIITTRCLYYLLSSPQFLIQKDNNSSGATQRAITNKGLSKILVNVPDIHEQPAFTATLDAVSDLIRLRKRQLEELDLLVKQGGSAPASGDGEPGGQGTSTAQDGSEATDGKGGIVTAGNCGKAEDHQWGAGDDPEDAQAAAREIVNAAVSMMNEEIRGLMPAGFMSQVQRINAPPVISWQALLKKYVGTISAEKRRTRTRLNRRQPDRFDLSGAIDEKILKIVVAVDTSGSMDDAQIQAVFREIFAILAKRKYEVTIIECDAKVQRVYKVSKPANIALSVKGRGGTAFTPVVEYINNDRYFRDALLIYFTDGYGENAIPRPRTYRNLWVILGNTAHLSLREPYGTKVAMQQAQRR